MVAPLRILVIDDDAVDRMAIRRALKKSETVADVEEVADSTAALQTLLHGGFDCVFLDYLLPGTDGMEILRKARSLVASEQSDEIEFASLTTQRIRLNITKATQGPTIWEFELYAPQI